MFEIAIIFQGESVLSSAIQKLRGTTNDPHGTNLETESNPTNSDKRTKRKLLGSGQKKIKGKKRKKIQNPDEVNDSSKSMYLPRWKKEHKHQFANEKHLGGDKWTKQCTKCDFQLTFERF